MKKKSFSKAISSISAESPSEIFMEDIKHLVCEKKILNMEVK